MKKFAKEFKEFALHGNLFDMAVGVLVGAMFKDLVAAFTQHIIMPILGIFTGGLNFSEWKVELPSLFGTPTDPETGEAIKNYLTFGDFISALITFIILALVVFLMIKGMNKLREKARKKKEEEAAEEPAGPTSEELLTEIRDILAEKDGKKSE